MGECLNVEIARETVPIFPNSPIPSLFSMPPRRRPPSLSSAESLVSRIDAAGTVAADTVATGFPSIDRVLGGGFRRRDLIVLAGDTGSGKSSLALGIAIRVALGGTPTVFFSGEMNEERLMERALALEGRATVDELRAGKLKDPTRASVGAAAATAQSEGKGGCRRAGPRRSRLGPPGRWARPRSGSGTCRSRCAIFTASAWRNWRSPSTRFRGAPSSSSIRCS